MLILDEKIHKQQKQYRPKIQAHVNFRKKEIMIPRTLKILENMQNAEGRSKITQTSMFQ